MNVIEDKIKKKLELNVNLILSCRLIGRISDIRDGTDVMQIFDLVTLTHNILEKESKVIQLSIEELFHTTAIVLEA